MTFLFRCGLGGKLFAKGNFKALVFRAIQHVDKIVGVDGERAGDGYVRRGHRFGETFPAGERVTFLFRCNLGCQFFAEGNLYTFVLLSIQHIGKGVGVRCE